MTVRTVLVNVGANVGPYVAGMRTAGAATGQFAAQSAAAQGAAVKTGAAMKTTATSAGLISPALLGAGGAALALKSTAQEAIRFEDNFAMVRKTLDGTEADFARISDEVREMSIRMPVATEEILSIASAAGQLGVGVDDIADFTETMAKLGVATNLTADEAAFAFARIATVTQTPLDKVDELGSVVVRLGNNMAATESEITGFALRIAGAGTQVGLTTGEIFALSGTLAATGIRAEAGGTAISRVMVDIAQAVDEGGAKLDEFAQVSGMSSEQFAAHWREDPAEAILSFITGLAEVGAAGESTFAVLEELGLADIRVRDALLRMSGAGDTLSNALSMVNDELENTTALNNEVETRFGTTASQIQIAKNAFADLRLELGNELLPILGDISSMATTALTFDIPGTDTRLIAEAIDSFRGFIDPVHGFRRAWAGMSDVLSSGEVPEAAAESAFEMWRLREATNAATRSTGDATGPTEDLTGAQKDQAEAAAEAARRQEVLNESLRDYVRATSEALDPVFRLNEAVRKVEEAQIDYNAAVDAYGPSSDEAEMAAWDLLRAMAELEGAALDSGLSFDAAAAKLDEWVENGRITRGQADLLMGALEGLNREARAWEGDYKASFHADLPDLRELANGIVISVTGRAGAGPNTIYDPQTTTTTPAPTTSSPSLPSQDTFMHDGGTVAGMAGWDPTLAPDERWRILQLGETVTPAGQQSGDTYAPTIKVYGEPAQNTLREAVHLQRLAYEASR